MGKNVFIQRGAGMAKRYDILCRIKSNRNSIEREEFGVSFIDGLLFDFIRNEKY